MRLFDGLVNLVSGMGTSRDKAGQARYSLPTMTEQQLLVAYKASSLVRRTVSLPAEDACREWREWQASAKEISAIEAVEVDLKVQKKVLKARRQARLFGGAALLIGTGDNDLMKPIRPARLARDGLKYLTVLSREDLTVGEWDRNIASPTYNEPTFWRLGATQDIHPSRLVIFHGVEPFEGQVYESGDGWGESVLNGILDRVTAVDEVAGNVLSLVYEARVDVVKIPDLMQNLSSRGAEYSEELIKRLRLAATGKGINGTLILDALEGYEQKSASFGGLPDIMDRMMQLASAAAGIPVTLLFGTSPGGLNATGDGEIRGYYDRVRVEQTLEMQPAMAVLDECVIQSALGTRPASIFYTWKPLWQPTAKERAETADKLASAFEKVYRMDVLPLEAIGKAVVNAFTETGVAPGLEADVDGHFEGGGGDDDLSNELTDAAPRTLYVHRKVLNGPDIIAWAKSQGFKTTLPADDLHVTIAFSRQAVDWMKMGESWQERVEVPEGGARIIEQFGEAKVLLFNSSELSWRHEEMKRSGATWDHPEYQPHITISYDPNAPDLGEIEPYVGKIEFGPEVFAEVNVDWLEGVKEA